MADASIEKERLKQTLNQLQQENSDLQSEVVKLRYSPHPQQVISSQQVRTSVRQSSVLLHDKNTGHDTQGTVQINRCFWHLVSFHSQFERQVFCSDSMPALNTACFIQHDFQLLLHKHPFGNTPTGDEG